MVYNVVIHLYTKEGKDVEEKMRHKLAEASRVYSKDQGTLSVFVMQDQKNSRAWCLVERFDDEKSYESFHVPNPYTPTLGADIAPWLDTDKPMEIHRFDEIDTSVAA
ncbi:hypothetical protein DFH09DRAFT_1039375 [Mycena vulgaris]|nr:hypothetical protein DFH09DRAFT_1039375 [Mycena vulgaris]